MKIQIKRNYIIYLYLILFSLSLLGCAEATGNKGAEISAAENGVSVLKALESQDISSVEKNIRQIQDDLLRDENYSYQDADGYGSRIKASYRYVFDTVVFMGDSQAEPLSLYGFLDPSSVVAEKGRNVISAEDDVSSVVKLNPQKIVLLYGVNDMLLFKTTEDFIAKYESLILSIQTQLPQTDIYANSVYPVEDFVLAKKPLFKRSSQFNAALIELCDKLAVTYIDSTGFITEAEENYAPDGIHFLSSFYPTWLNFIKNQLDL